RVLKLPFILVQVPSPLDLSIRCNSSEAVLLKILLWNSPSFTSSITMYSLPLFTSIKTTLVSQNSYFNFFLGLAIKSCSLNFCLNSNNLGLSVINPFSLSTWVL
uniref:Uncharacterized 11.4 kDa protein n=1 Tax=Claviceps purpurea TaxID=5111 RepID=YPC6_CLAPU|nr:RecName: Full=Uncharacterized 11.4 kDa protein; AltName: Full=ORF6 [Claviceps purpurea]